MEKIKNSVKILRSIEGITQKELAKACNLHIITINNVERGLTEPKLETKIKIARFFNRKIEEVFFDQEVDMNDKINELMN